MGRVALFSTLAAFLCACSSNVDAGDAREPALELTGRVVDAADILSPKAERDLTGKLEALERTTKAQMVVASTPSLEGKDILYYSVDLARAWGLGDKERNDGLMLLIAPNERKVRIEVGYGLESVVEDYEASRIIEESMIPDFKRGDFETGISKGVDRLIEEIESTPVKVAA